MDEVFRTDVISALKYLETLSLKNFRLLSRSAVVTGSHIPPVRAVTFNYYS